MTTGLSASVFLTESSIREPKEESGEEEDDEALAATALAWRAATARRGRGMDRGHQGRPRLVAGRRQRVGHGGGICGDGTMKSRWGRGWGWRWRGSLVPLLSTLHHHDSLVLREERNAIPSHRPNNVGNRPSSERVYYISHSASQKGTLASMLQ